MYSEVPEIQNYLKPTILYMRKNMTTIQPEGEQIRKAVQWISDEKKDNPGKSRLKLIEEAGMKFNLSPIEEEYLATFVKPEEG